MSKVGGNTPSQAQEHLERATQLCIENLERNAEYIPYGKALDWTSVALAPYELVLPIDDWQSCLRIDRFGRLFRNTRIETYVVNTINYQLSQLADEDLRLIESGVRTSYPRWNDVPDTEKYASKRERLAKVLSHYAGVKPHMRTFDTSSSYLGAGALTGLPVPFTRRGSITKQSL